MKVEAMRILCTGSRNWTSEEAVRATLEKAIEHWIGKEITIIHGGAPGADTLVDKVARSLGLQVMVFKARWKRYGNSAGPIRNARMILASQPDLCIAFGTGKGTEDCVRKAERIGVPVVRITLKEGTDEDKTG